jgi:hypothetical protein
MANLAGAKVYVIGAGMIGKNSYRDSKTLALLTDFWTAYFNDAQARLEAIGTPMLLEDIQ